jgi:hypothetical protein
MVIEFLCPYGHRLKAPDHRAGKKGRCPTCQQRVIVPTPNPIPSGREKRDWDASPGDRIELDDPLPTSAASQAAVEPDAGEPDHDSFVSELLRDIGGSPGAAAARQEPAAPGPAASGPIFSELELPPDPLTSDPEQPAASTEPFAPGVHGDAVAPSPATTPPAHVASSAPPVPAPLPPPLPSLPPIASLPELTPRSPAAAPQADSAPAAWARPAWIARARAETIEHAYRANPQQIETAYWLAVVLLFVIVFSAAPALGYLRLDQAPAWAQAMLLVAGMQLAYTIWLVIVPDWSTVRVGLWLFGASAVFYAAGAALFAMAGAGPLPLDLAAPRSSAAGWCGANSLALGLLGYACGQVGATWRRADFVAWSAITRRTASRPAAILPADRAWE